MNLVRSGRRALLALIGVILALVAFELCLQAVSFVVWARQPEAPPPEAGRPVILCVGDSFTHGMGASDPATASYPAVLERELEATGTPRAVVVAARPSRNSREILIALDEKLAEVSPERVYILAGINDVWSRPEPLARDELDGVRPASFPLRWRTGRLFALAIHWLRTETRSDAPETAPYVGTWHAGEHVVAFFRDGRFVLGTAVGRWQLDGADLQVQLEDAEPQHVVWRVDSDELTLESTGWPEPIRLARGPGPNGQRIQMLDTSIRGVDRIRTNLAANFGTMVELCRERGAVPVLLSYPWTSVGVEAVARDTALSLGVEFIDIETRFLSLTPRADYAVADGHCNDRGYAAMARFVAEDVLGAVK